MKGTRLAEVQGSGVMAAVMRGAHLLVIAVAVAALFGAVTRNVSATQGTLRVDSGNAFVGEEVSVAVHANTGVPGLGAWTVDITYDSTVMAATGCAGASAYSVCSTTFGPETVLVTGAHTTGLIGDTTLATFAFRCERAGTSQLSISVRVFADATPDNPQDIDETVQNGAITCVDTSNGPGVIRIDTVTANVGELVPVTIRTEDIPAPGLSAWTIGVTYDTAVASVVDCLAYENGVCNIAFQSDVVRTVGASATGLSGNYSLGVIVFRCGNLEGVSELHVSTEFFGIFEPGTRLPDSEDGAIACVAPAPMTEVPAPTATPAPALPSTSQGGVASTNYAWPAGLLVLVGAASIVAALALRRRA